jgi:hypothetical protein
MSGRLSVGRVPLWAGAGIALILGFVAGSARGPQARATQANTADAKSPIEGAWKVVGVKAEGQDDYQKVDYNQYKLVTNGHFIWAASDPNSGAMLNAAGGTYTIEKNQYTERIQYAQTYDLRALVGKDQKFTWKVEGDKWFHTGTLSSGQQIDELWERVKK